MDAHSFSLEYSNTSCEIFWSFSARSFDSSLCQLNLLLPVIHVIHGHQSLLSISILLRFPVMSNLSDFVTLRERKSARCAHVMFTSSKMQTNWRNNALLTNTRILGMPRKGRIYFLLQPSQVIPDFKSHHIHSHTSFWSCIKTHMGNHNDVSTNDCSTHRHNELFQLVI